MKKVSEKLKPQNEAIAQILAILDDEGYTASSQQKILEIQSSQSDQEVRLQIGDLLEGFKLRGIPSPLL